MPEEQLAHAVFMTVVLVAGAVGNALTLFAIARHRPLRNVTGAFMANLAAADFLQSVFGMPFIISATVHEEWVFGRPLCVLTGMTNSLFCVTSMLTLTAVSLDRFLAIVRPLRYNDILTPARVRLVLLCIWGQSLLFALLPVFGWSTYAYLPYEFICTVQWDHDLPFTFAITSLCFGVPAVFVSVCYFRVMLTARKHAQADRIVTLGRISTSHQNGPTPNGPGAEDGTKNGQSLKPCRWVAGQLGAVGSGENDTQRSAARAKRK